MRFTQDSTSGVTRIRAYAAGELRINDRSIKTCAIVSATDVFEEPLLHGVAGLAAEHIERVLALDPELVLLGSGEVQAFPPQWFAAEFLRRGIGFEAMNTGAACRTFNVLVAEKRRVVAVLLT